MHTLSLALSLFLTQAAPSPASAPLPPPRVQSSAADQADAVVNQAFGTGPALTRGAPSGLAPTAPPAQTVPGTTSAGSPLLAALVLLALGGGALFLRRRKAPLPGSSLLIHERVSLGPKRMLALAQWGDELLLLGVTDSGVSLLKTQPAVAPRLVDAEAPVTEHPQPSRRPAPLTPAQTYGFEGTLQAALGEELYRGETTEGDALLEKLRAGAVGLR